MNQKIKVGNIYRSNVLTSTAYIVAEVNPASSTIVGLRTNERYNVKNAILLSKYELIGIPYNQEPVNET